MHKGYRCLSSSSQIYTAKSVSFDEDCFPFASNFQVKRLGATDFVSVATNEPNIFGMWHVLSPNDSLTSTTSILLETIVSSLSLASAPVEKRALQPVETNTIEDPNILQYENQSVKSNSSSIQNTYPTQTRSKSGIFKPKVFFAKQKINTSVIEPTSVEQALLDTNWKKAIEDEYNAPFSNNI